MSGQTKRVSGNIVCLLIDDPVCAPCRGNEHALCSWDGCPDCECTACPAERKAANLAALDAEIGTAYGPSGDLEQAAGPLALGRLVVLG